MCTVVFIPVKESIFLGSLRDENPQRPMAVSPKIFTTGNISFIAPTDPVAAGTWVGVSNTGNAIILLNGAFENHQRKNYYSKSRGLIVTELLAADMPVEEWNRIYTEDTEPFTLIVWSYKNLFQLVWDGSKKHCIRLDETLPHIWSSSTLYTAEAKYKRKELFQNWVSVNSIVSELSLLNFFKTFADTENGFIINRNDTIKTLSFSLIVLTENHSAAFSYSDLLNHSSTITEMKLLEKSGICRMRHKLDSIQ